MEVTNENQEDTLLLTKQDLALASFALAETFNSYLTAYNEEDYEGATKEQMERSLHQLRTAFIKFDAILAATQDEDGVVRLVDENKPETTIEKTMIGGNLGYGSFTATTESDQTKGEDDEIVIQSDSQNEETSP